MREAAHARAARQGMLAREAAHACATRQGTLAREAAGKVGNVRA